MREAGLALTVGRARGECTKHNNRKRRPRGSSLLSPSHRPTRFSAAALAHPPGLFIPIQPQRPPHALISSDLTASPLPHPPSPSRVKSSPPRPVFHHTSFARDPPASLFNISPHPSLSSSPPPWHSHHRTASTPPCAPVALRSQTRLPVCISCPSRSTVAARLNPYPAASPLSAAQCHHRLPSFPQLRPQAVLLGL